MDSAHAITVKLSFQQVRYFTPHFRRKTILGDGQQSFGNVIEIAVIHAENLHRSLLYSS